jgi:hypothetical protein
MRPFLLSKNNAQEVECRNIVGRVTTVTRSAYS